MRPAVTRYNHNIVCLRILRLQVVRITPGLLERDVWAETVVAMYHVAKQLRQLRALGTAMRVARRWRLIEWSHTVYSIHCEHSISHC
jgi:hypothetical protein